MKNPIALVVGWKGRASQQCIGRRRLVPTEVDREESDEEEEDADPMVTFLTQIPPFAA